MSMPSQDLYIVFFLLCTQAQIEFFFLIYYSETKRRHDDQITINYFSECSVLTLFVFSI